MFHKSAFKPVSYPTFLCSKCDKFEASVHSTEDGRPAVLEAVKKLNLTLVEKQLSKGHTALVGVYTAGDQNAIKRFCESPIDLIDSFLARNHDLSQIGKTLIALCILNAERKSRFLREIIAEERIYDWYGLLFNIMVEELKDEDGYLDFKNNRVDFITFNYDRSLEYFLYDKLKTTYGSIDLIKNRPVDLIPFRFIHVYGKIDNFEWEDPPGLAYKSEYYIRDILRVGGNIKLIHERDNEFLDDIKKTIAKASKIFFLGFGYDEDNMRALSWPENFNEDKRILGTAFNLPQSRIKEIRAMIQKGFKNPGLGSVYPIIKLLDCRSLLDEYRNLLNE